MNSPHVAVSTASRGAPPHGFGLRKRGARARRVLAAPELVRDGLGVTPEAYPAPAVQEVPAGRKGGGEMDHTARAAERTYQEPGVDYDDVAVESTTRQLASDEVAFTRLPDPLTL